MKNTWASEREKNEVQIAVEERQLHIRDILFCRDCQSCFYPTQLFHRWGVCEKCGSHIVTYLFGGDRRKHGLG